MSAEKPLLFLCEVSDFMCILNLVKYLTEQFTICSVFSQIMKIQGMLHKLCYPTSINMLIKKKIRAGRVA